MTNPEMSTELRLSPEHLFGAEQEISNIRGLTVFDESLHADVGRYRPQSEIGENEEGILVVESFNAPLKHLGGRIATFTRFVTQKEYSDRLALYHENPNLYADIQIDNLKR